MMIEAVRGLARVAGSYHLPTLLGCVRTYGATPLALVSATARRHPGRVAWRDAAGELTYAEVARELQRRRSSVPVVVRVEDPRELVLTVLGALSAGQPVAVLGTRGGSLADEAPRRGVSFLTSGTTGAPRAHSTRRTGRATLPYLGMIGRLPLLRGAVVGSPSHPDHGHAFLVVLLTWAMAGTYVQISGPVGPLDVLSGVPVQLADVLDGGWCASATHVVSGSDKLPAAVVSRLRTELGAEVWDAYGATETGPICLGTPTDVAAGTVGRPLPGVRVSVDGEHLVVRTPAAAQPFCGDRGRVDAAGRVVLSGRGDGRLVSGGEVVDPERLRRWLLDVPGVETAVVEQVPDSRFGVRLVARLSGPVVGAETLRARIAAELGPAHVPRSITLSR